MTIQEIYDTRPVETVEYEIIDLQQQSEKDMWGRETGKVAIQSLLEVRKAILNEMFVLDEHHLQLIKDFNESIKQPTFPCIVTDLVNSELTHVILLHKKY